MKKGSSGDFLRLVNSKPRLAPSMGGRHVVWVNTEGALLLVKGKAVYNSQIIGETRRKVQVYWYAGKYFVWVAGITCPSSHEPFPGVPKETVEYEVPSLAQVA